MRFKLALGVGCHPARLTGSINARRVPRGRVDVPIAQTTESAGVNTHTGCQQAGHNDEPADRNLALKEELLYATERFARKIGLTTRIAHKFQRPIFWPQWRFLN